MEVSELLLGSSAAQTPRKPTTTETFRIFVHAGGTRRFIRLEVVRP
jgi:hypothetical protein